MCDPISIIGLGLSVGMAVANYSAQQDMMNQQNAANDAWVAYQKRQSDAYLAQDTALRQKAEAAREASLTELTPQKQQAAQANEQARLVNTLTPEETKALAEGKKSTLNDKMLSGQQNTAGPVAANIQQQIQQAAQEARQRIAALAAVQSYGGSQFGLTNRANVIFNAAGQDIRQASDERQGAQAAYNVAKAVEPIKIVQYGGGSALGGLANAGAQIAGGGLGKAMASSMATSSFG
jgi:hypothetical protein